jgi:hypothetical protein
LLFFVTQAVGIFQWNQQFADIRTLRQFALPPCQVGSFVFEAEGAAGRRCK